MRPPGAWPPQGAQPALLAAPGALREGARGGRGLGGGACSSWPSTTAGGQPCVSSIQEVLTLGENWSPGPAFSLHLQELLSAAPGAVRPDPAGCPPRSLLLSLLIALLPQPYPSPAPFLRLCLVRQLTPPGTVFLQGQLFMSRVSLRAFSKLDWWISFFHLDSFCFSVSEHLKTWENKGPRCF